MVNEVFQVSQILNMLKQIEKQPTSEGEFWQSLANFSCLEKPMKQDVNMWRSRSKMVKTLSCTLAVPKIAGISWDP